ncbi:hypothetical protein Nmel_015191 [Mimus melanotis]
MVQICSVWVALRMLILGSRCFLILMPTVTEKYLIPRLSGRELPF